MGEVGRAGPHAVAAHEVTASVAVPPLVGSDFEDGTAQGWGPRIGTEHVAVTDADAHGGTHGLLVTARTQTWMGPAQDLVDTMGVGRRTDVTTWNDPNGRTFVDTSRWGVALRLTSTLPGHRRGRGDSAVMVAEVTVGDHGRLFDDPAFREVTGQPQVLGVGPGQRCRRGGGGARRETGPSGQLAKRSAG